MLLEDNIKDVLIIDDDEDVIQVLEMYCEDLEVFRLIVKANNGLEAASKLANQKFHLILMDVNMPKKTGVEIVSEFSRFKMNSLSNVVLISGELDRKMIEQTMKYGVKNYLVKPFDEATFKAKVMPILKSKNNK